ncbi:MAG: imidazole glycerol phosphate synthase subunit HisF [Saprospiraceae bacterium]|nr:imidazole glycerol phosphate synthase subunit HisF [Saprospiraceae bacterium]
MLKKRIIPCLDIRDGRTVKGVNFVDIRDAGDPVELARAYAEQGADELVFLDITATVEGRQALPALVERIAKELNIPFTVGGGINQISDVKSLLDAGADKVAVNSAVVRSPQLISALAGEFGSQCIVVAIDTRRVGQDWFVAIDGGRTVTPLRTCDWVKEVGRQGAGEILLTSMEHDGTKTGFATGLLRDVCQGTSLPVIASGGAGSMVHFAEVFQDTMVNAALAASVFHYGEIRIPALKDFLHQQNIPVRWNWIGRKAMG